MAASVGGISAALGTVADRQIGIERAQAQHKFIRNRHREFYQFERKSLEDAGYNPLLAFSGKGASSAAGGLPTSSSGATAGAAAGQIAAQSGQRAADKKAKEAAAGLSGALKGKAGADEQAALAQAEHHRASALAAASTARQAEAGARQADAHTSILQAQGSRERGKAAIYETEAGQRLLWVGEAMNALGPGVGSALGGFLGGRFGRGSGTAKAVRGATKAKRKLGFDFKKN